MFDTAAQEICEIRSLLVNPTPENFGEVTRKLGNIASLLENMAAGNLGDGENKPAHDFVCGLPREIAAVRKLMQAPLEFYEGLRSLRAAKFGSYERTGTLRSLEPPPSATTLVHL